VKQLLGRLLIGLAIATAVAHAAPQSARLGSVSGRVFSAKGFAVQGARVMLQSSDGSAPRTTRTNREGRFSFPLLFDGLYDVRATAQGRSTEWLRNVNVRSRQETSVTLHLQSDPRRPAKTPTSWKKP
jgi:hypothetical protein